MSIQGITLEQHGPSQSAWLHDAQEFAARVRRRLHDRRFWVVQALVLVITGFHGLLEVTDLLGEHQSLAFVPVSFYLIPVLYAGLNFGMDGALPTALWVAALTVPNAFIWHTGMQRAGEFFQLTVMVTLAVLVARRVDREAHAKERAERIGWRLAQLNDTAAAVSRSLEPQHVAGDTLDTILSHGRVDTAWIALTDGASETPALTLRSRTTTCRTCPSPRCARVIRQALADGRPRLETVQEDRPGEGGAVSVALAPVRAAGELIGALGIASHERSLGPDDLSLLEATAHQLAVALDNIRHYQKEKRALAELTRAQENLVAYLRLAINAQEEERKRLARELHDGTIQSLVVIKSGLDALRAERPRRAGVALATARIDTAKGMLQAAIDDIRRFSRDLRPSVLDDLGLEHAIDWLVADIGRRTGVEAHLDVEGAPRRLGADVEVAIFRIVQEALHNVEKHAAAARVVVTLTFSPAALTAEVSDDGHGFDSAQLHASHGVDATLGLLGMQERARLIGGCLSIDSRPGAGTRVAVTLRNPTCAGAAP